MSSSQRADKERAGRGGNRRLRRVTRRGEKKLCVSFLLGKMWFSLGGQTSSPDGSGRKVRGDASKTRCLQVRAEQRGQREVGLLSRECWALALAWLFWVWAPS